MLVLTLLACPATTTTQDTDTDTVPVTDSDTDVTSPPDTTDTGFPGPTGDTGTTAGAPCFSFPADDREADVVLDAAPVPLLLGTAVAVVDLDGDAIDDLLVGAPYQNSGALANVGRVWVEYGPVVTSGVIDDVADAWFDGENAIDRLGSQIGVLGDLDGDGLQDVAAFAELYSSDEGRIYIEYGDATRHAGGATITATDATVTGDDALDRLGNGVTGIGDLDQDGFDDIAFAAPFDQTDWGRVYVLGGRATRASTDLPIGNLPSIEGVDNAWMCRGRCLVGDDFDGDGLVDLAIAADAVNLGKSLLYLRYGDGTMPTGESVSTYPSLEGPSSEEGFGQATAAVGDVDGDGYADLAVADNFDDTLTSNGGLAWIIRGDSVRWTGVTEISSGAWLTIEGVQTFGQVGASLLGLGDVDCDGRSDFAMGSVRADGVVEQAGTVTLWSSVAGGTQRLEDATATLLGGIGEQDFGASMAGGDLDGDGEFDLVVGAPNLGIEHGRVYVFLDAL